MNELCLVTGGAGFIGSHLVETLTTRGHSVRVLDNFGTGLASNLQSIQPAPAIIEADLADPAAVSQAMQGVGVVYHLGALASVQFSVENPLASHRVCATGTLHVLDAARRAGVRRVVYAGSSSAYGLGTEVQKESDPLSPLSPYAAAKLAGEHYMHAFASSYGLETVCLRFFNIFGPRQRDDSPYSGVIALFLARMSAGKTPVIFGDGLQTRDFTYVGNAVQALLLAAQTPGISGRVYNVGTGRGTNLVELVSLLNRFLGTNLSAEHAPARSGEVRHSRADISRAREELGYEPGVTLAAGLEETVRWYRGRN